MEALANQSRRAAINSFGFSGTNAHMVLEEYIEPAHAETPQIRPVIIVLSAKNTEQLQEYAGNLYHFLQQHPHTHLVDLAYTLQLGREALDERLGLLVSSMQELQEKLAQYLAGDGNIEQLYRGQVKQNKPNLGIFSADEEFNEILNKWFKRKKYHKLLDLWVKGLILDWDKLYLGIKPRKISAPIYPFAKERYWINMDPVVDNISESMTSGVQAYSALEFSVSPEDFSDHNHINIEQKAILLLQQLVADQLQRPFETIPLKKGYFELGINSIGVMRMTQKLQELLDPEFTPTLFFEYASITDLAKHFTQQYAKVLKHLQATPTKRYYDPLQFQADLKPLNQTPLPSIMLPTLESALSEGQKGFWLLQKINPSMTVYNIPIALRFEDTLDPELVQQTMRWLIAQHPMLQSQFLENTQGEVYQKLNPHQPLSFTSHVVEQWVDDAAPIAALKQRVQRVFDLAQDALLRIDLWNVTKPKHSILLITIHHVIFDGFSCLILVRDFLQAYRAYANHSEPQAQPHSGSYFDFIAWEAKMLTTENAKKHAIYWKQQLGGDLPILDMPTDYPRPVHSTYDSEIIQIVLDVSLTQALKQLAQAHGVSLFMVLLGIYKILLSRHTNQTDIIVGIPVMGRPESRFEQTIGYFINMVPLRSQCLPEQSFSTYIKTLRQIVITGLEHAAYPFTKIVADQQHAHDPAYSPLFQTSFVLQNFIENVTPELRSVLAEGVTLLSDIVQEGGFDLGIEVLEQSQCLHIKLTYNPRLFGRQRMERFIGHYQNLAQTIIDYPDQAIGDYCFLGEQEKQTLLIDWNQTQQDYPQTRCIQELFEQQVEYASNAIAVVCDQQSLTYLELNERANQLAHHLREVGVVSDTVVGIYVKRSLEMMVGLLGILKSGGVFLPIDVAYPQARIDFMLADANVQVLLTQEFLRNNLAASQTKVICLDSDWSEIQRQPRNNPSINATPQDLAYVIYTSGSTGRPKGVLIEHQSLVNLAYNTQKIYSINRNSQILQFASISFDVAIGEWVQALMWGAALHISSNEKLLLGDNLSTFINTHQITHMTLPPSALTMFSSVFCSSLETIAVTGEGCSQQLVFQWAKLYRFLNLYGPTETTVWVSANECNSNSLPHIGRPLDNTKFYIMDTHLQPVPIGVVGELYIGGVQIARGYLNRPELSAEKFISDPFSQTTGARLYKTGDLARYQEDGNITCLGRIDYQIKIRGFRIELGEIEATLIQHPAIRDAVVIAREDIPGYKNLAAYFLVQPNQPIPGNQYLREYLNQTLPDYMLPNTFVRLETLPITSNGKVDRKALPAPGYQADTGTLCAAPNTEIEHILAKIWSDVLKLETVGIHDNFFDIGGHSLLLTQVHHQLKLTAHKEISLIDLYHYPTIHKLACYIDKEKKPTSSLEVIRQRANKRRQFRTQRINTEV